MNLRKETDAAEKHRTYMREYMRKKRAEEKLAKMNGNQASPKVRATKTVTRKRTRTILDDPSLLPLQEWDTMGYQAGTLALEKVLSALQSVEPDELSSVDIKRLADVAVKLRTHCGHAIGTEEAEEESLLVTDEMLGDDAVIDHINGLIKATARDQLNEAAELRDNDH